jgi:uncharacterized protein (DUF4415 family)
MSSACVKQKKANKPFISETDEDAPLVTQADLDRGRYRINLKDVSRDEWNMAIHAKKQRINIMLDASIVSWFKLQAGDRGYQTLINETLKQAINHQDIENILRRVVREELKHAA